MTHQAIRVRFEPPICFIQLNRPNKKNSINEQLVEECRLVLAECADLSEITVVVFEGDSTYFCEGADFDDLHRELSNGQVLHAEPMYDLWTNMSQGPYVTVAHVRGGVKAGGVGFVAASDIVLADETARFSLPEMLFGILPACVMPFLARRVGAQRAHYLTLTTQSISVHQAHAWGLVDAYEKQSEVLLRRHLARLACISRSAILRYRQYMTEFTDLASTAKPAALSTYRRMFLDLDARSRIFRYVDENRMPWDAEI